MKRILLWLLVLLLALAALASGSQRKRKRSASRFSLLWTRNGDKLFSRGEGLENAVVFLTVGDHSQVKALVGGKVTFSLPYAEVDEVRVEIPYLAVGEESRPRDGVAQVKFRLDAPELPVYLP